MKGRIEFEFKVFGPTDECWVQLDDFCESLRVAVSLQGGGARNGR